MRSFSVALIFVFLNIIFCSSFSVAQEIPEITGEDFPGLDVNRNDRFNGESLWGYMNGGADIYLEYGFQILRVEEFYSEGETIKLELYKMDDPISAFGIYSFKTFKCQQTDVLASPDCLNKYQYQLVYGNYYIQLINESGSEKAKAILEDIAATLLQKIEPFALDLPATYLQDSLAITHHDMKMIKGPLGIQNKAMALIEYFDGLEGYQIYYAKKLSEGRSLKYYEIIFDSPDKKDLFLKRIRESGFLILENHQQSLVLRQPFKHN